MPSKLVLLLGKRGSGKTRLAARLSHKMAPGILLAPRFPERPCDFAWEIIQVPAGAAGREVAARVVGTLGKLPGSTIALDDAETLLDPWLSPRDTLTHGLQLTRNDGLSVVLITKTPMLLPGWVRANADVIVYRPWDEPGYAKWLTAYGAPIDPLPDFHFYVGPDPTGAWRTITA